MVVVYLACFWSNRNSGSLSQKNGSPPYFYFRFGLESPRGALFALFWPVLRSIVHRRLEKLSIKKPGAPDLNLWPESTIQKKVVITSARNGPKSREIDRNSKNVVVKPEVDLQNRK